MTRRCLTLESFQPVASFQEVSMPWLLLLITLFSVQDHHRGMNERGAMVMGFDQQNTSHHFTYTAMVAPSISP